MKNHPQKENQKLFFAKACLSLEMANFEIGNADLTIKNSGF
jgi:hypothetical protein